MDKISVLSVILVVVLLISAIYLFKASSTTGAIIYGRCWEAKKLSYSTANELSKAGCSIESNICSRNNNFCTHIDTYTRVCCPSKECPAFSEIYC